MKKMILATLTVATLASFAYFQNSTGSTCTRTDCDGPKIVADTCPYAGCQELVATTCNGSDADCSDPKITASIIIHCSQTTTLGGCVDGNGNQQNETLDKSVASIIIHCSQTTTLGGCIDSNTDQNLQTEASFVVAGVDEVPCGDPLCCGGGGKQAEYISA